MDSSRIMLLCIFIYIVFRYVVYPALNDVKDNQSEEVLVWLETNSLNHLAPHVSDLGIDNLHDVIRKESSLGLSPEEKCLFSAHVQNLKRKLAFHHAIAQSEIGREKNEPSLVDLNLHTLQDAVLFLSENVRHSHQVPKIIASLEQFTSLPDDEVLQLEEKFYEEVAYQHKLPLTLYLPTDERGCIISNHREWSAMFSLMFIVYITIGVFCLVLLLVFAFLVANSIIKRPESCRPFDSSFFLTAMIVLLQEMEKKSNADSIARSMERSFLQPNYSSDVVYGTFSSKLLYIRSLMTLNTEPELSFSPFLNAVIFCLGWVALNLTVLLYVIMAIIILLGKMIIVEYLWIVQSSILTSRLTAFLKSFRGINLNSTVTTFRWQEPVIVGKSVSFTVQFFRGNGQKYFIQETDDIQINVALGSQKIGLMTESADNEYCCHFTARHSGEYSITVMVGNSHVRGSPFLKKFNPGPPCLEHTSIVSHSSIMVCEAMHSHTILVEPRDKFRNICLLCPGQEEPSAYTLIMQEATSGVEGKRPLNNEYDEIDDAKCGSVVAYDAASRRYTIHFLLQLSGSYHAKVLYKNELLPHGSFSVVVLTDADRERVDKFVRQRELDGIEVMLQQPADGDAGSSYINAGGGESPTGTKQKKLYCYITPKQLILKEYWLRIIPRRYCTFRLCPSTKLYFSARKDDDHNYIPLLTFDDGCQPALTIASKDRDVLAATFTKFMLKNIGGSETFKDKQDFFYHQVRKLHLKKPHERLPFAISREKLLESSMKVTRGFSVADWCKCFDVSFINEDGLDWGGVGREWVELLCAELFETKDGLFTSLSDHGPQSLVHPNSLRPGHLKLKHYEFAGRLVGKCLFESALGGKYHLSVRARFSRSFLAQIIGLRVNYTHFAQDDPELYQGKVEHLLKFSVSDLPEPIYFTDDQLTSSGELKTIDLINGGFHTEVTDVNKLHYLDALAQFRLVTRVQSEVNSFLSGLNEIIPDNLLCIFDENELELLMCGTEQYSVADLKANHVVDGSNPEFKQSLAWFWTALANFSDEEMARLLQFTTGCSRLPPGGFAQLSPQFQIVPSHSYNSLPLAHTCFNQICLPYYDSYEQLEKALLLAIKEGCEGFCLA